MPWHDTPTALTIPFALASSSTSITGRMSVGQLAFVMQCISSESM